MKSFCVVLMFIVPFTANSEVLTRIIDTGAGHASVTLMPSGHVMVFDAGRRSQSDVILDQIKSVVGGRRHIDLLVISHTDADHLGAIPAIFDEFEVKMVLRTGLYRCKRGYDCQWGESHQAIRRSVELGRTIDLNLRRAPIDLGYTFRFGESQIQVVSGFYTPPDYWELTKGSSDWLNAGSIVVRLTYQNQSILFTGDEWGKDDGTEKPAAGAEAFMISHANERPINADVLIASHHGADDASSLEFVRAVSPQWVILPAGGSHRHPRQHTVDRILAAGVPRDRILRTDLCDRPGVGEWVGGWVLGSDDSAGDDHIDIILSNSNAEPVVRYVHGSPNCPGPG